MGTRRRSPHKPGRDAPDVGERLHDAITELSAYALWLDAECHRLDDRVLELAAQESSTEERRAAVCERAEIAEELSALRRMIRALAARVTDQCVNADGSTTPLTAPLR